jgi:hypothetical protein
MKQPLIAERIAAQKQWMADRGTTLAGYIDFYCAKYGNTLEHARMVYEADLAELQKLEAYVVFPGVPRT